MVILAQGLQSGLALAATVALLLASPTSAGTAAIPLMNSRISRLTRRGAAYGKPWTNQQVPYIMNSQLPQALKDNIAAAMRTWEQATCARFVPKKDEHDTWINFKTNSTGCWAQQVGMPPPGEMTVNLADPTAPASTHVKQKRTYSTCSDRSIAEHELGHVLGLIHEQQRPDRDQFITINMDAIVEESRFNYNKVDGANISIPFDYESIMMYETTEFAKDKNNPTMTSTTDKKIAPAYNPTAGDTAAVRGFFKCDPRYDVAVSDCNHAPIPDDNTAADHSSYEFVLDEFTANYMAVNGYTHIGVHQHCAANKVLGIWKMATDNWAFTPFREGANGFDNPYTVTDMDRCKNKHNRHASQWEIALCKGDSQDKCDTYCGYRNICPVKKDGSQVDSKAVNLKDDALWVCHPHK